MSEAEAVSSPNEATQMVPHARPRLAAKPSLYDYPSSDGKPIGETPWHMRATLEVFGMLTEFFRGRPDVYVGGNMMMYYIEDDTNTSVSPDVFVTLGVPKLPERRVWRTWVEGGRFADFVLEVTSESTKEEDEGPKKDLFARLGVREYWQFDPEGEYLEPRLKGHRLDRAGRYQPLALEERDAVLCHKSLLGLELRLEGERLRLYDPARGVYLMTYSEQTAALAELDAAIAENEAAIAEKEAAIAEKKVAIAEKEAALREADARLADLDRRLKGTED